MHVQNDDEVIVARCLAGDQAAFAFLVDKYKGAVHAYAYHRILDYEEAQDIVQEVFIKAYKKLAQLKWPHRFRSWLYTIASHECSKWLRERLKEQEQEVPLEDVPVENLNELAIRNHSDEDIDLTVRSAMETLPDDSQLALSLYYMSDLSTKEVAGFMGISPNHVGVKLHRARKQLGERVEKMIGKRLSKEKLKAGFIFRTMDSIRDMPIPSLPKPRSIRWAPIPISIGIALLVGIIGYGVSSGKDVSRDIPILKLTEEPVPVSLVHEEFDTKGNNDNKLLALNTGDSVASEAEGSSSEEIVVRKVGYNVSRPSPSPDGRYLSFANENGNMAILDLATGERRELTDEGGNWDGARRYVLESTWSPDSKQVACRWSGGEHGGLRIVKLDGSQTRDLYNHTNKPSGPWIEGCQDWSEDGKYILAMSLRKPWLEEIALVSVADGSIKTLKSSVPSPEGMSLSPDGRYVVYDLPVKEHEDLRDLFILATDGSGQETRLTEHPANDYDPVWSPDGNGIVFASNRDPGGVGLWLIQVDDGKPVGEARMIKREAGGIETMGFTHEGSLFYITITNWSNIYVASVDMEAGKLLSEPELMPLPGMVNTMPAWSPDGKSLAYVSERALLEGYGRRMVLVIRSIETGEERELLSSSESPGQLRWSPDGRSILYGWGWDPLRLIDIQTGHITEIAKPDSRIWGPAWSPDGKTIFFTRMRHGKDEWPTRMMALDLETREERELYSGNSARMSMAVSPDGGQLAFLDNDPKAIKVIPTEGGEPHTLITSEELNLPGWPGDGLHAPFAWTPDGRYILFMVSRRDKKSDRPYFMQIWRVSPQGGEAQKLIEAKPTFGSMNHFPPDLHPDGQRIAFQKGRHMEPELWMMENLMSTARR